MADVNADFPNSAASMGFLHRLLESDRASELAEMIRGIAHEFNQPLASMATFSQAGIRMLDRSDPLIGRSLDVFRQISQEALDAGARLQSLRRVFDQGAPQQHRCQMADLLKEVQPVLDNLTRVIKAQLQVDVPTGMPDICVDRLKIQRVLLALVRNAVDASSDLPAERVIRIDVLADRYSIEVGITDRGVGVPQRCRRSCSSRSLRARPRGMAWDWPQAKRLLSHTAARSGLIISRAAASVFGSNCLWRRTEICLGRSMSQSRWKPQSKMIPAVWCLISACRR